MACKGLCEVKCGGDNLSEISSWVKYPSSEIPLRVSFKGEIPLKEPSQGTPLGLSSWGSKSGKGTFEISPHM